MYEQRRALEFEQQMQSDKLDQHAKNLRDLLRLKVDLDIARKIKEFLNRLREKERQQVLKYGNCIFKPFFCFFFWFFWQRIDKKFAFY